MTNIYNTYTGAVSRTILSECMCWSEESEIKKSALSGTAVSQLHWGVLIIQFALKNITVFKNLLAWEKSAIWKRMIKKNSSKIS